MSKPRLMGLVKLVRLKFRLDRVELDQEKKVKNKIKYISLLVEIDI